MKINDFVFTFRINIFYDVLFKYHNLYSAATVQLQTGKTSEILNACLFYKFAVLR